MFAVIFEVQPKPERWDDYLDIAKTLRPSLEAIDGFIDNERFSSRRQKGRLLSLSIWRDEKAVIRWRTLALHHQAQEKGRSEVFEDYHLRVGEITADSGSAQGEKLRQQRFDETEVGVARSVTISEWTPAADRPRGNPAAAPGLPDAGIEGLVDHEVFESITSPGKLLLLAGWREAALAEAWEPKAAAGYELRHRQVRIIRDYGMLDRREAPQFYPGVAPVPGARRHKSP
jgi:heme-degrading monooxygenase HmoA